MYLSLSSSSYIDVIALNETAGNSDISVVRLKIWNAFLFQFLFDRSGWTVYTPSKSSHVILRVYVWWYSLLCYLWRAGGHLGSYQRENTKVKCLVYIIDHHVTVKDYRNKQQQAEWKEYEKSDRASLVAQWLRIRLLTQGTQVRALVWEDPTCHGATRPMSHNYWVCASGACAPQQERPR